MAFAALDGVGPPASRFGGAVDAAQTRALAFLQHANTRACLLALILANLAAVVVESVPAVDRAVGNAAGNFFDTFEALSVALFTAEYGVRVFSVSKDKEHLYSASFYATTFFGIVDVLAFLP